jgi:hypothetical protein
MNLNQWRSVMEAKYTNENLKIKKKSISRKFRKKFFIFLDMAKRGGGPLPENMKF